MHPIEPTRTTLFATLSDGDFVARTRAARLPTTYRRGAHLFRTGEPCDAVTVVIDGYVRLARPQPGGASVTPGIARPGDWVGVAALCGAPRHDRHAISLSRVRAVDIPTAALRRGRPRPASPRR